MQPSSIIIYILSAFRIIFSQKVLRPTPFLTLRSLSLSLAKHRYLVGNRWDTAPMNEKGPDMDLRAAQIELRLAEFEEAYHILCQIRNGDGEKVAQRNLRKKGYVGASSRALDGVNWASWKDRFHTERVTAAGHSFGAATVVEILRHADKFKHVEQGIIYDIWGYARPLSSPFTPVPFPQFEQRTCSWSTYHLISL
jgi:hypothetical protein